jgi:hypothetical protein
LECTDNLLKVSHQISSKILWRIDLLLGKDLEANNETTAVAMKRRSKRASAKIELLLETVFSTRSVQRGYNDDYGGDAVS